MRVESCSLPELFFNDTVAGSEVAQVLEISCSKMRRGSWLVVLAFNTLMVESNYHQNSCGYCS